MKHIALAMTMIAALVAAYVYLSAASEGGGGWFMILLFFWVMGPFALTGAAVWWLMGRNGLPGKLLLWVAVALCALATWAYVDGFYFDMDAQNGLLFLFVPLYQGVVAGCCALVALVLPVLLSRRKRDAGPADRLE